MAWFLTFAGVFCTWAFLCAIGSERHKRMNEIKVVAAAAAADAAKANPAPPRKP